MKNTTSAIVQEMYLISAQPADIVRSLYTCAALKAKFGAFLNKLSTKDVSEDDHRMFI
jgi:hypothetical protein